MIVEPLTVRFDKAFVAPIIPPILTVLLVVNVKFLPAASPLIVPVTAIAPEVAFHVLEAAAVTRFPLIVIAPPFVLIPAPLWNVPFDTLIVTGPFVVMVPDCVAANGATALELVDVTVKEARGMLPTI